MPLGEYEDFAACVAAQKEKGHDMESAQKICGEIQKRVEGMREFRFENIREVAEHEVDIWPARLEVDNQQMNIYFHDVIGPSGEGTSSTELVPRIESASNQGIKTIRLNINTVGGSVSHGMSMFNALQEFPGQVLVDITGEASSIGGVMALAGDTIRIYENASFYMHPANIPVLIGANEHLLNLALEYVQKGTSQVIELLSIRSGQSLEQVKELLHAKGGHGTVLTGKEAVEWGFADELVSIEKKKDRMMDVLEIMREQSRAQASLIRNKLALTT